MSRALVPLSTLIAPRPGSPIVIHREDMARAVAALYAIVPMVMHGLVLLAAALGGAYYLLFAASLSLFCYLRMLFIFGQIAGECES